MAKLSRAQRWKLPKSEFACPSKAPGAGSYPISDKSRVISAVTYYQRKGYQECPEGKARICRRASELGIHSAKVDRFCKG